MYLLLSQIQVAFEASVCLRPQQDETKDLRQNLDSGSVVR